MARQIWPDLSMSVCTVLPESVTFDPLRGRYVVLAKNPLVLFECWGQYVFRICRAVSKCIPLCKGNSRPGPTEVRRSFDARVRGNAVFSAHSIIYFVFVYVTDPELVVCGGQGQVLQSTCISCNTTLNNV